MHGFRVESPGWSLALSAKGRYYSAKREGNEHVCDYLNRLNGYARNAGVQFEKGGRETKEHVKRFLESCGDKSLERRQCHLRVKDIHELKHIINDILLSEERGSTRETSAYLSRGRDRSHGHDERRAETPRYRYRRDRHDRHGRGYDRRKNDSHHTSRISLTEASLSEMMAELQVRGSKYWRSECSKYRDMRRSLEDSSSEDAEDRSTDEDQSGSDYAGQYHFDEHDRHVAAANDAERRNEAIGTYGQSEHRDRRRDFPNRGSTATPATKASTNVVVSMDPGRHAGVLTPPPTTVSSVVSYASKCTTQASAKPSRPCAPTSERSAPTDTGLVPIGLPQLPSPPVDADCVYAFVGESTWRKTQRREEVNEVNTTEIEKERNGSFGGGEGDERKNEEWNSGGSEGLVSGVTKKTWHHYQPENVIKLLSGERLGWWSAQKFDKRVRMRALVQGPVHDARTRIQLDIGANISVISERFAKQLRLRECMSINYGLWDHGAGVDVVLGTDFMIPAGVRLDLFHATTRPPGEVEIPLIKTQRMADTREEGPHVPDGPTEVLTIPRHESRDYPPKRQPPTNETHELWVRRTMELIAKVVEFRRGRPRQVRSTNISDRLVTCPVHLPLMLWVPRGDLPRTEAYAPLGSDKYNEWRVLAYSRSRDSDLYKAEGEIYKRWLAAQPSAVERVPYKTPTKIMRRPSESSEGSVSDRDDQAECATATPEPSTEMVTDVVHHEEPRPNLTAHPDRVSEGSEVAQLKLEGAYLAAATV
ncbi:unnamed protein product [Phytophthora fragariaefolia]|uniref:Unnamed protein product n=1 Tax=Phytophthora fragariaefolia TaxID=1490495 RepID=A0A9W6XXX8_9STRA|nr:unnamed protein product [Phytophthora fragariaefolia]